MKLAKLAKLVVAQGLTSFARSCFKGNKASSKQVLEGRIEFLARLLAMERFADLGGREAFRVCSQDGKGVTNDQQRCAADGW